MRTETRWTRSNGASSFRSNAPLELEQVRRVAPSVFAEGRHSSRSEQYSYIPTSEILAGLSKEGFLPFAVAQGGSRDEEKRGFTKHVVRLRHRDAKLLAVGDSVMEIVLGNSHDGTSAYWIQSGLFRLVCLNGLTVQEAELGYCRVPHKGDVQGKVIDGCIEVLSQAPEIEDRVGRFVGLALGEGEREAFASAALALRWDEGEAPVEAGALLLRRRVEDAPPTLWNTFNVVQENVTRGGLGYVQRDAAGRKTAYRRTREVRGVDASTNLNRALWTLAAEMERLKRA